MYVLLYHIFLIYISLYVYIYIYIYIYVSPYRGRRAPVR